MAWPAGSQPSPEASTRERVPGSSSGHAGDCGPQFRGGLVGVGSSAWGGDEEMTRLAQPVPESVSRVWGRAPDSGGSCHGLPRRGGGGLTRPTGSPPPVSSPRLLRRIFLLDERPQTSAVRHWPTRGVTYGTAHQGGRGGRAVATSLLDGEGFTSRPAAARRRPSTRSAGV